jgi:protein TonB
MLCVSKRLPPADSCKYFPDTPSEFSCNCSFKPAKVGHGVLKKLHARAFMETPWYCISLKIKAMTPSDVLQATLLDIVFESRNKDYGAYALRKQYNRRLVAALTAAVSVVLTVLYIVAQAQKGVAVSPPPRVEIDELIVHTKLIPPDVPPVPTTPVKPSANRQVAQQQYAQIRITKNEAVATDVPPQVDLNHVVISNATAAGISADAVPAVAEPVVPAPAREPEMHDVPVSAEPQFPGGVAAWQAFLSRNLEAPEILEPGEKKTVVVHFMVAEDGTVAAFTILQSGGRAFDEEVIRVLKKMPKWKPALKNGVPISVSFAQPVTFIAMGY